MWKKDKMYITRIENQCELDEKTFRTKFSKWFDRQSNSRYSGRQQEVVSVQLTYTPEIITEVSRKMEFFKNSG